MSARLLVAVLCVCCNGTSVTVLSLCSVSRAIGAERSLFARDGRQIDVQRSSAIERKLSAIVPRKSTVGSNFERGSSEG